MSSERELLVHFLVGPRAGRVFGLAGDQVVDGICRQGSEQLPVARGRQRCRKVLTSHLLQGEPADVLNALKEAFKKHFFQLVFAEICRWKSYSRPQDTYLAHSVMDSIFLLFEKV